ncbi:MAG: Branched amino acid binding transporter [Bradyrhizobium sp.]|jgi:NitT/TauT family transport system permease protein|nr:Branched amino acid binding transporter [Bradyrhizobium sp.]MEA2867518.1 NitT/TauT family transport system permease protein [Bradyrhizobium sp.]
MSAEAFPTGVADLPAGRRTGFVRRHADGAMLPIGFIVICIAGLEILARTLSVPEVLFPSPSRVLMALTVNASTLGYHATLTISQVVVALFISLAVGISLATVFTLSRVLNDMFSPLFVVLQIIPKIALAPLFVVWFGTGALSHFSFAVCLSFFPVLAAARAGFEETSADAVRLCSALGASRWQTLIHVKLPMALPQLFVGAKVSTTLCIIGVVLGEFVSAKAGIGWYIVQAAALSQTANILASLVVLSLFGLCVYGIVSVGEILVRRKMFG